MSNKDHVMLADPRVDTLAKQIIDAKTYAGYDVRPWDDLPDCQQRSFRIQAARILFLQDSATEPTIHDTGRQIKPVRVPAVRIADLDADDWRAKFHKRLRAS